MIRKLAVYCGSAPGTDTAFADTARALVREMAARSIDMVYGGGRLGLMGIIADEMLAAGGKVYGVIPQALVDHEVAHTGLTELTTVANMHERKMRMFDLSDAFIALPGGFGTLDEMFEMLTWRQLGIGDRPCAFLDVDGFYAPLMAMIDRMVAGVLQADGSTKPEPRMDAEHVGSAIAYMASLPLDANVLFMTVMATKMPFVGRG